MCFTVEEAEISFYLTALWIPVSLLLILACLTGPLLKRLKKHRTYGYDDITVVKTSMKGIALGITFGDDGF